MTLEQLLKKYLLEVPMIDDTMETESLKVEYIPSDSKQDIRDMAPPEKILIKTNTEDWYEAI